MMNILALRLVRLRFSARMLSETAMPQHKASLFHGVFGRVLHRDFPYLYNELYGSGQDDASLTVHPYILLAPLDESRNWEAGHEFTFELTLFGRSVRHAQACCDALRLVGRDGLGEDRAKFTVYSVDHLTNISQAGSAAILAAGGLEAHDPCVFQGVSHANEVWANVWRDGLDTAWITPLNLHLGGHGETYGTCNRLVMDLQTPLRLKHDNRLVCQAPDFYLLFARLLARLNMLAQAQGGLPLIENADRTRLLELAGTIELVRNDTRWVEWSRYSSSQKASMQFGGLMGELEYGGELTPFLPFLRMAELTHLGGKTTFGLGRIIISCFS